MRIHRKICFYSASFSFVIVAFLASCTPGERPFLTVQLCLVNSQGVDLFKQTLQSIARDEHMRYIDGSKATTRDLKVIEVTGKNMHTDGRLVFVGVEADSGPSLMAGNLGLNPYEVSVGFARGGDTAAAHVFSDTVVAQLKRHWSLKIVPQNSGAFPSPECAQSAAAPPNHSVRDFPSTPSA
jgi:hypothetical protein